LFHTGGTEGKKEFSLMTVGEDRMVEVTWRQNLALDEAKVGTDVCVTRIEDETRMSFGIDTGLVDPWVQGGHIDVMDLLSGGDRMVQLDSIGTTPAEGVTGVKRFCKVKGPQVCSDVQGAVFETGPITFPHFHDCEPLVSKLLGPLLGGLVDILHGSFIVA